jgi:hypothetical protein
MHLAWRCAAGTDPEFYLWLNDDTYLRPRCLATLLGTYEEYAAVGQERRIVVASCCDPATGEHSYGGEWCAAVIRGELSLFYPIRTGRRYVKLSTELRLGATGGFRDPRLSPAV